MKSAGNTLNEIVPVVAEIQTPRAPGRCPLVTYVTGGGFFVSPKQSALRLRTHLAKHGFVVANIQYRTVKDGANFRDGVADVKAAIGFPRANADEFNIDSEHIGLWGESASGYLASMAGLTGSPFCPGGAAEQRGGVSAGLLSGAERKNPWTLSEQAGQAVPDRMQLLLSTTDWDPMTR